MLTCGRGQSRRRSAMIGWRARLGFMVPPGNPTVEPEMIALAPQGVSVHFHRMDSGGGVPGALDNQDRRTRAMIDSLDAAVPLLAAVRPDIIIIAHTATSYHLGREREAALLARLTAACGRAGRQRLRGGRRRARTARRQADRLWRAVFGRDDRAGPRPSGSARLHGRTGGKPCRGDQHLRRDRRTRLPPGARHRQRRTPRRCF